MRTTSATFAGPLVGVCALVAAIGAQSAPPPTSSQAGPLPFPGSNRPPATAPIETPPQAAGTADAGAVDPRLTGVSLYPGAALLEAVILPGQVTQTVFIFGTNDAYDGVVAYYKAQFRRAGEEVSKTPAIQQFDLGAFNASTMAQRPSVIVKDFTWPDPAGYLHVSGVTERRFKTLIQIIPVVK